ncbi:hypothetical protein [uncultured Jatrophihabitans sp.]|uniref:hypothetical protein n=1 Tax=uncultured Jatrophihabitans sp. TaxID=1610747 RepID=UPI0035C9F12B
MRDDLEPVRRLLPDAQLEPVERLRGGERCRVDRIRVRTSDADHTAVVKRFLDAGEGWVRETAALRVLPPGLAPQLLAADAATGVVVMSDLGDGPTVADALLGADPDAAADALCGWAEAVARLHAAARPLRDRFVAELAARQGELHVSRSRVTGELGDAATALPELCARLGVSVPTGAMDELRGLATRLGGDGASSLSPVDTCPDDAVRRGARYLLVDYEGAQWRHVTWDVAYLRVPWPTCWCSWAIPDDAADRAVEAYRRTARDGLPEVGDAAFERDLEAATVGWALTSVTWFVDRALQDDVAHHPDRTAPTRRATVLHRLGLAARSPELPALAELSASLRTELRHRWGDVELALAPAFRPRS